MPTVVAALSSMAMEAESLDVGAPACFEPRFAFTREPSKRGTKSRRALNGPVLAERPVAVDLFSGAGGLSYAFWTSGFHIAACVENDRDAVQTYRKSFVKKYSSDTQVIAADIRDAGVIDRLRSVLGNMRLDVMIGGPPCQDFSPACLRRKRREDRMTLVSDYLRILEALKPRVFLFENVPGLLVSDDGAYWRMIEARVERLGYRVRSKLLDAQEFGVPQRRRRLFVVGVCTSGDQTFEFPSPSGERATVRAAIGHLKPLGAGRGDKSDPDHRARAHRPEIVDYIKQIPVGGHWRDCVNVRILPCHEGKPGKPHGGHWDVYGRMLWDEVGPTITGGCTNPSRGRFIHPSANRGLTVREAALLQTFPPDWRFCGGIESASQQVGNAVPVKLGQALAVAVRQLFL